MVCFLCNWVWQSWYSEINVVLLFLIHRDGFHRTCLIIFNMFRCQHATFCGLVSGYKFPCTRWICALSCFSWLRVSRPNLVPLLDNWVLGFSSMRWMSLLLLAISGSNRTSNYLCKKSPVVVEVTHTISGIWFRQISSQLLSIYNKLGVYRKWQLHYILFDRTSILFVEQAVYRPNTPYLSVFSTSFACVMQDVVGSSQALLDLGDSCAWGSRL